MTGLFGALWLLLYGTAHAHKNITESIDNNKSREEARKVGKRYYNALDGERAVDTNHKILRLPDGIKDMQTGQWLFDKKEQDENERVELSKLDEISKQEATIKGEVTYWCTLHESDPRRYNINMSGQKRYQRLVSNNMPIDCVRSTSFSYYNEEYNIHLKRWYDKAIELQFGFHILLNAEPEIKEKAFYECKNWNMKFVMEGICESYPINKVEVIYNYCKKYNIPLGTWSEIESMMLEKHPLGWRKVPECKDWEFEKFISQMIL